MNEIPRVPKARPTTQVADGVPRLRWTFAEFERLAELGFFTEDDRIELIGGELVPMAPKGNRHEVVRAALHNWLRRNLSSKFDYHSEPGWHPDATNYFESDFLVGSAGFDLTSISPSDVALLIEVAHSSLAFDTTTKAGQYAALGIREYWVVNAVTLAARVHRGPAPGGYGDVDTVAADQSLAALLIPSFSLTLADLRI
ncbi:MAG: Uma2 family endonuclease [Hyphomicrobiaceae bacterium]